MAEGEQSAGAIFLEFKAQLDNLEKGFASVNGKLDQMATKAQASGKKFNQAGQEAAGGFDGLDRNTLRAAERVSRVTARIISLQFAIGALTQGAGGLGDLGRGLQSAAQGFQVFGAFATLAKDKMGLAAAGVVGLAVGLAAFVTEYIQARIKMTDETSAATDHATASIEAYGIATKEAAVEGQIFGDTLSESVNKRLEAQKTAVDSTIKRLRQIPAEMKALQDQINAGTDVELNTTKRQSLVREKSGLEGNLLGITGSGGLTSVLRSLGETPPKFGDRPGSLFGDQAAAKIAKLIDKTQDLKTELTDTEAVAQKTFDLGFVDPSDEAAAKVALLEARLKASQEILKSILERQVAIDKVLDDPRLTPEARQALKDQRPGDLAVGDAKAKVDRSIAELKANGAPQRFADTFATPFSQGIADGVVRGIQEGKTAVQTLAGVGENLFNNFLQKAADNFVTTMTTGLKSIAGAGGEALGNLFTGLAGLAGFFLSGRGHGKGTSTFDDVKSAVTSTEQVRGIVAGPSSVPINQLGTNIANSMEPVRAEVGRAVEVLISIRSLLAGGTSAVPSPSSGGRFVAAPTA